MTREEWIRRNPLRVWRLADKFKVTQGEVATLMGVSEQSVRNWEHGAMGVTDANLSKLQEVTEVPAFIKKWKAWEGERENVKANR